MIKLEDSNIADIIQENLRSESVVALGYAINKQIRKIMGCIQNTNILSNIDSIKNEKILDLLAIEMKVPFYDEDFNTDTKKEVIKKAILLQKLAGTDYAIETMLKDILGGGTVVPWHKYGGEPGCFKIEAENQGATEDMQNELLKIINNVKRKSAWLDAVEIVTDGEMNLKMAVKMDELSFEFSKAVSI